ncbi:MAG: kynureninase, partial [Polymorphobacter sp.]
MESMLPPGLTRADAQALDAADPLAALVSEFDIAPGMIYLAGNSLGPLPRAAAAAVADAVAEQWGRGLVTSWNKAGWFDLPYVLGDRIAGLIGAAPGEVVMADSTGINLFKMVAAAAALNPGRRVIVMEGSNFPTNNYVVQGLARWLGQGHEIRFAEADTLADAITDDVAVVALTHIHYRTAHILDMAGLTARA